MTSLHQQQPAVTFPSLCHKVALPSPSLFLVVDVVLVVGVVVLVLMFKLLYLAEICTLTSTF